MTKLLFTCETICAGLSAGCFLLLNEDHLALGFLILALLLMLIHSCFKEG